ncbi:ABC transporter substrate-binding protein [Oceanisphaera sp. KMM 10153]|uniref:ABC transporter substrate-binding protein n=1 Tax=Oceanisphaera submarina TaxID=3390193 RepID=UPI00397593D5
MCKLLLLAILWVVPSTQAEIALGTDDSEAQVRVGCLFPLSGRGGLYGLDSVVGIQVALDWIQQQPIDYPRLQVLIADSRSKASRATRLAREFVQERRARFICGVVNSAVALEVARVVASEQAFFIGTDHASPRLTDADVSPYYFRVNNNSRQSMYAAAHYIKDSFKSSREAPLRISYLGPDYDYGYQIWQDLQQALRQAGVRFDIVTALWPSLYEPDYTPYIEALKQQPTDLIINSLWGGDLVAFIEQANQASLFQHADFANFDTGGNYEVLAALANDMPAGLILSARHHNNWPPTDYNRWFVERFHALSGRYPSYAAEGAYAGILAIAETMRTVGVHASDAEISTALKGLRLRLPEDPPGFVSYMDPVTHQLQQVIAIGRSQPDDRLPPATKLLGDWKVYPPLP